MAFTKFSAKNLAALGEYKQNFRWAVDFSSIVGLTGISDLKIKDTDLNILCQSIELPKRTLQTGEIMSRGMKIKQAGWVDFENTMTITFMDTISNTVQNLIDAWQDLCFKTSRAVDGEDANYGEGVGGGGNYGLLYKSVLPIARVDMKKNPIYTIHVYGCFCEAFDPGGTLDEQSSDITKPSITLSFDGFYRPVAAPEAPK